GSQPGGHLDVAGPTLPSGPADHSAVKPRRAVYLRRDVRRRGICHRSHGKFRTRPGTRRVAGGGVGWLCRACAPPIRPKRRAPLPGTRYGLLWVGFNLLLRLWVTAARLRLWVTAAGFRHSDTPSRGIRDSAARGL